MRSFPATTLYIAFVFSLSSGQCKTANFEDYPAVQSVEESVPPIITDPVHRKYRTRIRDGVQKGWGAFRKGKEVTGPNFAGYMIAIRWGCGTGCAAMVFVDALTGRVYNPPLSIGLLGDQKIGLPMYQGGIAQVEYYRNSRLFKMKACPSDPRNLSLDAPCFAYDFLWEQNRWRLLRRQPHD